MMIAASVVLLAMAWDGILGKVDGLLLLSGFFVLRRGGGASGRRPGDDLHRAGLDEIRRGQLASVQEGLGAAGEIRGGS